MLLASHATASSIGTRQLAPKMVRSGKDDRLEYPESGDQCVLSSAMDAHARNLKLWVPEDATASLTPQRNRGALDYISEVLGASIAPVLAN
ncbi:MAG TPA: isochorismatase family protein [Rhodanobacteraceae bacterium]|nr:isochorismatase family protein [Rhodanobacteraceae bacterium]